MNRRAFIPALALLGLPLRARGSKIVREPLATVLKRTAVALVADVMTVGPVEQKGIWRELDLALEPVRIVFGKHDGKSFTCHYAEAVPHMRGSARVSPLASGSGQGFHVERGDRVIALLADAPGSLLRIEPLASLASIPTSRPQ